MVTTPRLPLDLEIVAGLRDLGRIFCPENSPETLPPRNGDTKLVGREALTGAAA